MLSVCGRGEGIQSVVRVERLRRSACRAVEPARTTDPAPCRGIAVDRRRLWRQEEWPRQQLGLNELVHEQEMRPVQAGPHHLDPVVIDLLLLAGGRPLRGVPQGSKVRVRRRASAVRSAEQQREAAGTTRARCRSSRSSPPIRRDDERQDDVAARHQRARPLQPRSW